MMPFYSDFDIHIHTYDWYVCTRVCVKNWKKLMTGFKRKRNAGLEGQATHTHTHTIIHGLIYLETT